MKNHILGICKISTWIFITVAAVAWMVYHCYSIIHTYAKVSKTTKFHSQRSASISLTGPSQSPIWNQRTTILERDGSLIVILSGILIRFSVENIYFEMHDFSSTIYPHPVVFMFHIIFIPEGDWSPSLFREIGACHHDTRFARHLHIILFFPFLCLDCHEQHMLFIFKDLQFYKSALLLLA